MKARCYHVPFLKSVVYGRPMSTRNRFETFLFNFGYRFHGIRVDGRQKQKETQFEFSKENGYMWTERCSKRKKRVLFSC